MYLAVDDVHTSVYTSSQVAPPLTFFLSSTDLLRLPSQHRQVSARIQPPRVQSAPPSFSHLTRFERYPRQSRLAVDQLGFYVSTRPAMYCSCPNPVSLPSRSSRQVSLVCRSTQLFPPNEVTTLHHTPILDIHTRARALARPHPPHLTHPHVVLSLMAP